VYQREANKEHNAPIGNEGPLVVTTYRQQGVKLWALVRGIHAKSGHRQFFAAGARRIGIKYGQV
jgi:hypothetical protein